MEVKRYSFVFLFVFMILVVKNSFSAKKADKLFEYGLDIGLAVGKSLYNNYLAEQKAKERGVVRVSSPVRQSRIPMSFSTASPIEEVVIVKPKSPTFKQEYGLLASAKRLGLLKAY